MPTAAPALPLPMFPLGTVLFPHMGLPLHIFEERYRVLTRDCLRAGREFGVVLIERGREVGGGDSRFSVGTVAHIVAEAEYPDGRWALATRGTRRIRITTWLPDDPYPLALVETLPDPHLPPGPEVAGVRTRAERAVRRGLALAAELGTSPVPASTFRLDEDGDVAAYQLCALAPIGPVDHQQLLEEPDPLNRLSRLAGMAEEPAELFAYRLGGR